MKRIWNYFITLTFLVNMVLLCGAAEAPAPSQTDEERRAEHRRRIVEDYEAHRARSPAPSDGAIILPESGVRTPASEEADMIVMFDGEPVRNVAQIYASVTGKEILVSSRIGRQRIKMERVRGTPQHIRVTIEEALTAHGVRIIAAGEHSIALVK